MTGRQKNGRKVESFGPDGIYSVVVLYTSVADILGSLLEELRAWRSISLIQRAYTRGGIALKQRAYTRGAVQKAREAA